MLNAKCQSLHEVITEGESSSNHWKIPEKSVCSVVWTLDFI